MAYKVQYLPVTGPLPGKSFENQTAAFLSEIGTLAENATGSGSEAITVAQAAQTAAQAAQTTSADAKTTAETAQSTAQAAETTATGAKIAADTATDTAADAKSAATAADAKSAAALSAAQAAQTTADAAESSANTAINNSVNAQTAAANAQTAAANAQTAATTAQTTAENAQTAAQTAQTTADAARNAVKSATDKADAAESSADATAAGLKSFMDTAGHPLGLATLDGDGKLVETAALADRALTAEGLSEILSVANGGTGNAEGQAASADVVKWGGNKQSSVPSDGGLSYCTIWGSNDPSIAENCGVPVAGVGSSLLSMHKENIDDIGNDITAQLFFSNDNELWLRTNAHTQNIQKSSPWIPMLTAINGFAASAFSTAQAFNGGNGASITLPAGGSWFYFGFEIYQLDMEALKGVGDAFAGVKSGGESISGTSGIALIGFYMKIA